MIEMLMAQMGIDPAQIKKQISDGVAAMQRADQRLANIEAHLNAAPFDIEAYISDLQWSGSESDYERTLVAGNLRSLYAAMTKGKPHD